MNRIVLIGNGFDLAHGLKTSYKDFINWYWDERFHNIVTEYNAISSDALCSMKILPADDFNNWFTFSYFNSFFSNPLTNEWGISGLEFVEKLRKNPGKFEIVNSPFFEKICKSIETKGWVDIENEYYSLLTQYATEELSSDNISSLNNQLKFLTDLLVEYLKSIDNQETVNDGIITKIYSPINARDISVNASNYDSYDVERIMLLSFNYTSTAQKYLNNEKRRRRPDGSIIQSEFNYIHGRVDDPRSVIFGYGDELDANFKELQNSNSDECLNNVKTIRYLESDNYKKLLTFMESSPYQVYIMGHSCGNSDRTLLNTLFEHKNCISIKPYYYIKPDGTDNYLELIKNISRNFTDMKLMRDRVVNKMYCETLL